MLSVNELSFCLAYGTMSVMKYWRLVASSLVGAVVLVLGAASPVAAQYNSSHYQANEVFFGNGGALNTCSTNYCSKDAVGETGVGNSSSPNYQIHSGFDTTDAPLLELNVSGGVFDLGILSSVSTGSTSTTFSVRSYLSSGYIVELVGSSPVNGYNGHALNPLTTPTTAQPGVEQFGINLTANTSPSVGAAVQQIPDSSFSFGQPTPSYNIANKFKFVPGDTIASSSSSSGETKYTMSIIADIANTTPAGSYGGLDGLYGGTMYMIVVPTF